MQIDALLQRRKFRPTRTIACANSRRSGLWLSSPLLKTQSRQIWFPAAALKRFCLCQFTTPAYLRTAAANSASARTSPNGGGSEADARDSGHEWTNYKPKTLRCVPVYSKSVHFKNQISHLWYEFSAYHSRRPTTVIQATPKLTLSREVSLIRRRIQVNR